MSLINSAFVARMAAELAANAHKGDWTQWHPDSVQVCGEIHHHVRKLRRALAAGDAEQVAELTADIGNLAMKAFEEFGQVDGTPELPQQR